LIDSFRIWIPTDWQQIADDMAQNYEQYRMDHYTYHGTRHHGLYSLLHCLYVRSLGKPVIVTGSLNPFAATAVQMAKVKLTSPLYYCGNFLIPEVTLLFNNQLFRGNRSRKVDAIGF